MGQKTHINCKPYPKFIILALFLSLVTYSPASFSIFPSTSKERTVSILTFPFKVQKATHLGLLRPGKEGQPPLLVVAQWQEKCWTRRGQTRLEQAGCQQAAGAGDRAVGWMDQDGQRGWRKMLANGTHHLTVDSGLHTICERWKENPYKYLQSIKFDIFLQKCPHFHHTLRTAGCSLPCSLSTD